MLSIQKLKNDKQKVNQHLTERGIKKENQKAIVEAVALTLQPKEFQSEQKSVDEQLAIMKREEEEKKLLAYQLKTNPETVSTFLANKYSDGNFNKAVVDQYDNTDERIKKGLTFEYHVYLPEDKKFDDQRGKNRYHLSRPITDHRVGDKYIYHIPVHLNSEGDVPYFETDYGEVIGNPKSRGLLWALDQLRIALDSGKFQINPEAEVELSRFGFLEDGKIVHDITGDVLVEKYLNTIAPEKRVEAIEYLDSSLKRHSPKDIEPDKIIPATPNKSSKNVKKYKKNSTPSEKPVAPIPEVDQDTTLEIEPVETTTTTTTTTTPPPAPVPAPVAAPVAAPITAPVAVTSDPTIPITPGEYKGMNLEQIAKINKIPVIDYTQVKNRADSPDIIETIYVLIPNKLYRINIRTGTRTVKANSIESELKTYDQLAKKYVTQGLLTAITHSSRVASLLRDKGFSALNDGKEPPLSVSLFSPAKTL